MEPIIKACQRCQTSFDCMMNDITNCQCNSIVVSQQVNDFLKKTNYYCLCKNCLIKINRLIEMAETQIFPRHSGDLEEGLHFYIENGFFVFTEFYHLLRGNCCGSGCRHCAYGKKAPNIK